MSQTQGSSALKRDKFTLEEWRTWEEGRWELIHGEAYNMSPAPSVKHQRLAGSIYSALVTFLKGRSCEPFFSPIDVFLNEDTVVQPDVLVVCDPSKLKDEGIQGAPDFIAEVLSDSTALKDLTQKRDLYEQAGVQEYWLVSQDDGRVMAYRRTGDRFGPVQEFRPEEPVPSGVFSGFIWESRRP